MNKYYFYDIGVRNAVIDNLHSIENRNDQGQIWENFLISERMKAVAYIKKRATSYFWRVYTGAEIDYVEDGGGRLEGFEFKWRNSKGKQPVAWQETYPNAGWKLITQENWLEFVR